MQRPLLAAAALSLFAGLSLTQVNEGQFLATVSVIPPAPAVSIGELYLGNTVTRTLTLLTIPAQLKTDRLNSVIMVSPTVGYVSTIPLVFPPFGDIYRITLAGTTVTASVVNTAPVFGTNISQLAVVGTDILFACQTPTNTLGILGKVPVAGGAPTKLVDFSTVTGFTAGVNSMAAAGTKAYVGTFSPSEIWEVDLTTNTPTKFADVPLTKAGAGGPAYLVNLQWDPNSPTTLVAQGVSGDYYRYDTVTKALIDHRFSGTSLPFPAGGDNLNSFAIDARTGDYVAGTRDGNQDLFVLAHNAEKVIPGLGSGTVPSDNSVTGIWYRPFTAGTYAAFAPGCSGQGGFTPTTFGLGTPRAGTSWGIGVASGVGGGFGLLCIGASDTTFLGVPLPASMASVGRPNCSLRVSMDVTIIAPLSGAAGTRGVGIGVVPLALSNQFKGIVAYCQWLAFTNTFALDAASDGRRIGIE